MKAFRIKRDPQAFSLDATSKRKGRGDKDMGHLAFVRKLPCCICGSRKDVEAAHIRFADPLHKKPSSPMGQKPPDRWVTPLCRGHHREQHTANERDWWAAKGIDPIALAEALFDSADIEAAEKIIAGGTK